MYRLKIHKAVTKFLSSLPPSQQTRVKVKLELLRTNPYHHPLLDIKLMRGMDSIYRLRVGKYRILYEIYDEELLVYLLEAENRGDIYKKLGSR